MLIAAIDNSLDLLNIIIASDEKILAEKNIDSPLEGRVEKTYRLSRGQAGGGSWDYSNTLYLLRFRR